MAVAQVDDELLGSLRDRVSTAVLGWRPDARVLSVDTLAGGSSSITFKVRLSGVPTPEATVVLKLAPPGLAPVRNRDVLRQARLLSQLQVHAPGLAPDLLFSDAGDPPEVAPFLVMNLVPGDCLEPILIPESERPSSEVVRARGLDAARRLADLHRLVPADLGLRDEPVVTLSSEVDRWIRAFETLPESLAGDYARVGAALQATRPEPMESVINHGDFRVGNTLCAGSSVSAVIDWEIWSVGDPRIDVSWLIFFADDGGHPATEPGPLAGTPTGAELVAAYQEASGREWPDLAWFDALTRFKEAGLTGLLLKRADKTGATMRPALARMRPELPRLLREAAALIEV